MTRIENAARSAADTAPTAQARLVLKAAARVRRGCPPPPRPPQRPPSLRHGPGIFPANTITASGNAKS